MTRLFIQRVSASGVGPQGCDEERSGEQLNIHNNTHKYDRQEVALVVSMSSCIDSPSIGLI
jgi:hypothetical protein